MFDRRPPNPRQRRPPMAMDPTRDRPGQQGSGGSMPGFTTPTIPSLIGKPGMYRGRDGQMKMTPTFDPDDYGDTSWGGGKGTFGGSGLPSFGGGKPLFGQGRPPIDGMGRVGAGPSRGPWDETPEGIWTDDLDEIDIDGGMGRIGGMRQYGAEGISSPANRRSNDPSFWQGKIDELRSQSNFVDPTNDWGDEDWTQFYEPGDAVNVKAGGNENFGKAWDGDSWEDVDWNDPTVASMSAESRAWDTDYQQGIQEAWQNNDEVAFQRWRNLGRANMTSKWQGQQQTSPAEPVYSVPRNPGNGKKPQQPKPPSVNPPTSQPDPWRKKQSPIY